MPACAEAVLVRPITTASAGELRPPRQQGPRARTTAAPAKTGRLPQPLPTVSPPRRAECTPSGRRLTVGRGRGWPAGLGWCRSPGARLSRPRLTGAAAAAVASSPAPDVLSRFPSSSARPGARGGDACARARFSPHPFVQGLASLTAALPRLAPPGDTRSALLRKTRRPLKTATSDESQPRPLPSPAPNPNPSTLAG